MENHIDGTFGALLREWRSRRHFSQLDLALAANVSARHIAFLETGRSRPSRMMVLQLSEALTVPRANRNAMLNSAGFSAGYRQRPLDDKEMVQVRAAMEWTLERHSPFPAIALDRHWKLVEANHAGKLMLSGIGVNKGDSLLDAVVASSALKTIIENWADVAHHLYMRMRTESVHLGGDAILDAAAAKLAGEIRLDGASEPGMLPAVIPMIYSMGETRLALFSTIAQFGSAEDIALADLKIELFFPADEPTRQILLTLADTPSASSQPGS